MRLSIARPDSRSSGLSSIHRTVFVMACLRHNPAFGCEPLEPLLPTTFVSPRWGKVWMFFAVYSIAYVIKTQQAFGIGCRRGGHHWARRVAGDRHGVLPCAQDRGTDTPRGPNCRWAREVKGNDGRRATAVTDGAWDHAGTWRGRGCKNQECTNSATALNCLPRDCSAVFKS